MSCFLLGYVDVGLIPKGARDIVVKEVEESGNFLALRSEDPEKYHLNGQFIIQWNGEYKAAGTTFFYERSGNLENLTSPGPTKEPVWLQVQYYIVHMDYCGCEINEQDHLGNVTFLSRIFCLFVCLMIIL